MDCYEWQGGRAYRVYEFDDVAQESVGVARRYLLLPLVWCDRGCWLGAWHNHAGCFVVECVGWCVGAQTHLTRFNSDFLDYKIKIF